MYSAWQTTLWTITSMKIKDDILLAYTGSKRSTVQFRREALLKLLSLSPIVLTAKLSDAHTAAADSRLSGKGV